MENNKVILIIMDGWGLAVDDKVSAITAADTPYYDWAMQNFPHTKLQASEMAVGLPKGQMGNSEVGHMNIGAGRIVYQDLVRINLAIENGEFAQNPEWQKLIDYCKKNDKPLHLLGLVSDGGVHSSIEHLQGLIKLAAEEGIREVYVHAFMDGRDTDPHGGKNYIQEVEKTMQEAGVGKVASVIGRYFAMDRDKRWPRVRKAYDLLVKGEGKPFESAAEAIQDSYDEGTTDEFIEPRVIVEDGQPVATLQPDDAVLFFNFRTDRGRQLSIVLTQEDMPEHDMQTLPLYFATMTRYDDSFKGVHVLLEKDELKNTLGDYLIEKGKTQIRIAETEKYPHVTFFFNSGRETPGEGEEYILCPSPQVATYDLQPEMSARDIRDKIVPRLEAEDVDFVCLNFANPDMVGHTGVFEAAVKACETVDQCTRDVVTTALDHGYVALVTADHGNADKMRNPDGTPHTAHTTALVPLYIADKTGRYQFRTELGKLGDLAPTILYLMGLEIPEEMKGDVLIERIKEGQPA